MVLNIGAWGAAQWTLYAIVVGLLAGMLGNMWANSYTHYKEERERLKGKSINWTLEFRNNTIPIVIIFIIIFIILIFS
jgi:small-conductance mechanosensitive channel